MIGKAKTIQYSKYSFLSQETIHLVVPDVELTQVIQNVFKVSVVIEPGTVTIVDGIPNVSGQVVKDFNAVTYVDPSNQRNMSMIYTGECFVGYFSMPEVGEDSWSQNLLEYLLSNGFEVVDVPAAFVGVLA
jgi:hypothetical protein